MRIYDLIASMRIRLLSATVLCTGIVSSASPQDNCGCDAVLIPSIKRLQSSDYLRLAYFRTLDRTTFDQRKRNGGIDLNVDNVLIGANMQWETFQSRYRRESTRVGFNVTRSEARDILEKALPKHAVAAWLQCKRLCFIHKQPLQCYVIDADAKTVQVRVAWFPPAGAIKPAVVKNNLQGAKPIANKEKKLDINSSSIWNFQRKAGQAFSLTINANGYAANVKVPKWQPPPQVEIVDVWFNINGAWRDEKGNRIGIDLPRQNPLVVDPKTFGKKVLSAKIIDKPFEGSWKKFEAGPAGNNQFQFHVEPHDHLIKRFPKNGPTFSVRLIVTYQR